MNIGLTSGTPKGRRSATGAVLAQLRRCLDPGDQVVEVGFHTAVPDQRDLLRLCACQVLVLAAPVYVDGLPGHLVAALEALERTLAIAPPKTRMAYAVTNCGFYEAGQNAPALELAAHWSRRAGLLWGGGLGLGGGGLLAQADLPMGRGPKRDIAKALAVLAHHVDTGRAAEDAFATVNLPRALYQTAAQLGWRRSARRNGLHPKDLDTQL